MNIDRDRCGYAVQLLTVNTTLVSSISNRGNDFSSFPRPGNEANRGVEFRYLTRSDSRIRRNVGKLKNLNGNGVS